MGSWEEIENAKAETKEGVHCFLSNGNQQNCFILWENMESILLTMMMKAWSNHLSIVFQRTLFLIHVWRFCQNVLDYLCFALLKMLRLLPKIEAFGGIIGPEAYQIKYEYAQRQRLRRNKFFSKSEVFPTWAPLPNPKEMKASLSKVQAFKIILQIAASKLRFSKLQSSNSIF